MFTEPPRPRLLAGAETSGIDAALALGGSISGAVTYEGTVASTCPGGSTKGGASGRRPMWWCRTSQEASGIDVRMGSKTGRALHPDPSRDGTRRTSSSTVSL
jgi:hypothetical protein